MFSRGAAVVWAIMPRAPLPLGRWGDCVVRLFPPAFAGERRIAARLEVAVIAVMRFGKEQKWLLTAFEKVDPGDRRRLTHNTGLLSAPSRYSGEDGAGPNQRDYPPVRAVARNLGDYAPQSLERFRITNNRWRSTAVLLQRLRQEISP